MNRRLRPDQDYAGRFDAKESLHISATPSYFICFAGTFDSNDSCAVVMQSDCFKGILLMHTGTNHQYFSIYQLCDKLGYGLRL